MPMRSVKVADYMSRKVITLTPETNVVTAIQTLLSNKISGAPIVDEAGNLVGILSERDIVRKLADTPGKTLPQSVEDVMTRKVQTCGRDEPLLSVLKRMTEGRFRHMPVVEDGRLMGMLTIGDVIQYRLTELEHEALQLKQLIVG